MREVTLYTTKAKKVLAGDRVEIVRYSGGLSDAPPIGVKDSNEALLAFEEKVSLPVIHMKQSDGSIVTDEFIAVDETIERLMQFHKNAEIEARSRAKVAQDWASELSGQLKQFRDMGFVARVKWALFPGGVK